MFIAVWWIQASVGYPMCLEKKRRAADDYPASLFFASSMESTKIILPVLLLS